MGLSSVDAGVVSGIEGKVIALQGFPAPIGSRHPAAPAIGVPDLVPELNIPARSAFYLEQGRKAFLARFAGPGERRKNMRKTMLVLLTVLSLAPTLSGCFFYGRDDWDGGGYRHDHGDREHGRYEGRDDRYRDNGERR
jgi:hypothetical protein